MVCWMSLKEKFIRQPIGHDIMKNYENMMNHRREFYKCIRSFRATDWSGQLETGSVSLIGVRIEALSFSGWKMIAEC